MKKIIILMFALLSCRCNNSIEDSPARYILGFQVELAKVKDSKVKYIKVAIKNIDKIVPKYKVRLSVRSADVHYDKTIDTYFITQQRKAWTGDDNKTHYFGTLYIAFDPEGGDYTVGKDRVFELKIYKNDDLFLTKKITLRTNKDPNFRRDYYHNISFSGHTDKVEVDNRDYVKEINVGANDTNALIIEIPDKPIKK